jgi:hypothetical protein
VACEEVKYSQKVVVRSYCVLRQGTADTQYAILLATLPLCNRGVLRNDGFNG